MRQPVNQIAYKYWVYFFKNWISVPIVVHQLTPSLRCKYCKIDSRSIFPDAVNSIRRLAAKRLQANDVSFLCRHSSLSPFADARTCLAYRRPLFTIFGKFEPQNVVVGHRACGPQKGTTSQRVFWAISREIPWPGCFSRRVGVKIRIKQRGLIFHVFHQALPYGRLAQILGYVFVSWT